MLTFFGGKVIKVGGGGGGGGGGGDGRTLNRPGKSMLYEDGFHPSDIQHAY